MADYTDTTKVANYLQTTLTAAQLATLGVMIPAVTLAINKLLGSQFDSVSATTRRFRGGYRNINIDPCQSISAVQAINPFDDTVWYTYQTPLEYVAEPYNLDVKTYLLLRANEFTAGDGGGFPRSGSDVSIAVTAKFTEYDYTNNKVPDDIVALATHIAATFLNNYSNADNVASESIEGHSVSYKQTVGVKNFLADGLDDFITADPLCQTVYNTRKEIWLED